jgi:hypothetical protein
VDVVVAYTNEFGIEGGRETGVTFDGTASHGLLSVEGAVRSYLPIYHADMVGWLAYNNLERAGSRRTALVGISTILFFVVRRLYV